MLTLYIYCLRAYYPRTAPTAQSINLSGMADSSAVGLFIRLRRRPRACPEMNAGFCFSEIPPLGNLCEGRIPSKLAAGERRRIVTVPLRNILITVGHSPADK